MRSLVKITACFAIASTLFAAAQAQNSKSNTNGGTATQPGSVATFPATPLPGNQPPTGPMMQMPLIVPLFLEGNQFTSTLTLVNNSTATTYADVTLRGLDGTTIASKRLDFTPHSQRRLDIVKLLDMQGSAATVGSIVVMQSPALTGPSIFAVLSMTYLGSADPNYIDEEIFMPSATGSQVLQGVADSGDGSPILAISSLAESVQHVQIQCLGKDGAGASRRIQLAAGETLVTDACATSDANAGDLTAMLEERDDTHGPQGIKLISDAMPGSFAAFALARHRENSDRFFSSVLFTDPKTLNSPDTVFTGVPVGAAALLPDGHYAPELTLTNFSNKELHVHTTFARTSSDTPSAQEVGSLSVPAHSTRQLSLRTLQGDPMLQNSFVVHSDGAPGDLMAKFVSKSNSRLHEVELQAKDEADMANAGAHPWSIEDNTDSTLLLFNHSTTLQTFTVTVSSAGFDWQKEYKLASMQTKAIEIRDLIDEQVKDDNGKTLPKNAKSGETSWLVTDFANGSGRLLQSDRSIGMARNFSCGYSGLLCGASTTFYNTTIPVGTTAEFANLIGITCTSGQYNACSGQQTGTANFSTNWVSLSPGVASISGGSNSSEVNLLGVSGGTSIVNGHMSSAYCQAEGGGTASVINITSISPANIYIGSSNVQLTINGGGFGSSPTVNLPSGVTIASQSSTGTQITLKVNVAYSAAIGNNNVSVTASGATSNKVNLVIDGPAYMTVNSDIIGTCSGCNTTVARRTAYQISNFSGSTTNLGDQAIGETASWSTPNCTPPGTPVPDLCASDPGGTSGSGTFSDQWTLATDNVSPVGCGFTVNYDHWQMCFNGNPITFGTLNGYVHSNSINILGSIMPPQSNQMQTGMRINP